MASQYNSLNIEQHGLTLARDNRSGPLVIPGKIEEYGLYLITNDEQNILGQTVDINRVPVNNKSGQIMGFDVSYAGTIYDPNLGSSYYNKICGNHTCQKREECIGHAGVIRLGYIPSTNLVRQSSYKFYYPHFISDIVKILISVCNVCSYSLLTESQMHINNFTSLYGRKRLRAIAKFIGAMKSPPPCPSSHDTKEHRDIFCAPNLPFDTEGTNNDMIIKYKVTTKNVGSGKASGTSTMTSKDVWKILNNIRPHHARWLGFEESHPRDLLFDKLVVVPPCTRPGTTVKDVYENNKIDSLYNEVININNALIKTLTEREKHDTITVSYDNIQYIKEDISNIIRLFEESFQNWPKEILPRIYELKDSLSNLDKVILTNETSKQMSLKDLLKYKMITEKYYELAIGNLENYLELKNEPRYKLFLQRLGSLVGNVNKIILQLNDRTSSVGPIETKVREIQQLIRKIMVDVNQTSNSQGGKNIKMVKSLLMMIKGKKGHFRHYLLGKSVGSSARSVIRNDPYLGINQVGVPTIFGPNLTVREGVTLFNKHLIDMLWDNGRISLIEYQNRPHVLIKVDKNTLLSGTRPRIGDNVYRWLQDGDVLIVNRQPSLHKQSMLGMIAKTVPDKSIGIPIQATKSYNADFDGDEMNLHVPQGAIARLETSVLAGIGNCIIAEQDSDPINAATFDAPASMYQMTNPIVQQTSDGLSFVAPRMVTPVKYQYYTSVLGNNDSDLYLSERLQLHGMNRYSGPALFSRVLPHDFFYRKGRVIISDGLLIAGSITNSDIGAKRGGIIKALDHDPKYGPLRSVQFIDDVTQLSLVWNADYGLTMSVRDCFPDDPQFKQALREVHNQTIERSRKIMIRQSLSRSKIEKNRLDKELVTAMDSKKELIELIDTHLDPEHSFRVASESGSKGTAHNLIACVTGGRVIQLGGKLYSETATERIPYHPLNATELHHPKYRGLVLTSLATGSTRESEYYIAQAGREGMVSTGITIQKTGAISRDTRHFLQNLIIDNNGSVVDAQNGMVVSLIYGNDGLNPRHLTPMNITKVNINAPEMLSPVDIYRMANQINREFGLADNLN